MGMEGFFLQKESPKIPGGHKIGAAISCPRIAQISFEPGFGAYQSLAQVLKVPFSRIFSFFLQF